MKLLPPSGSRAVTIAELIVALAVVFVLASLLFGWMQMSRKVAQSSKCVANLRVLGTGALAFMNDHGGFFFPDKYWYQASWDAKPGMRDYVGVTSREPNSSNVYRVDTPFTCPAMKTLLPARFPNFLNRAYTLNRFALRYHPSTGNPIVPGRLANIPSPSAMWMLTEGLDNPGSEFGTNIKGGSGQRERMVYPHSDRQHVLFFDGRVAALSDAEFWDQEPPRKALFWGNANPD